MSTKNHYGLKLTKAAPPILEIGALLGPLVRPVLAKRMELLTAVHYAEFIKENPDEEPSYNMLLWDIDKKIDAAHKKLEKDYLYGVDFSVTFLKGTSGRTLAWPAFQIGAYYDVLIESGWFEEWGYWDNTDEPEGVTLREWNARGKEWEKAFGPDYRAIDRGLTWEYKPVAFIEFSRRKMDWDSMRSKIKEPGNRLDKWILDQQEKAKDSIW